MPIQKGNNLLPGVVKIISMKPRFYFHIYSIIIVNFIHSKHMHTPVQIICTGNPELNALASEQDECEQMVVFELIVPGASKVPPPDYQFEMAQLMMREGILTSLADDQLTLLAANNTAVGGAWYISVSIAAPAAHYSAY
jgi:hypothetical protein